MRIASIALAAMLLGVAALATVQAQEPISTTGPEGSISGRLIFEGWQPTYEEGAVNISFALFIIPADRPQPIDIVESLPRIEMADADGIFSIGGLANGDYLLLPLGRVGSSTPAPEVIMLAGEPGAEPVSALAVPITVADGEAVVGIEIRILPPKAPPTPTPTPAPTGSISGRLSVEGDSGMDLRNVILSHLALIRVEAQQPFDPFLLFDLPTGYHVEADDEGNFTFASVADGEYFLMVLPPDFGLPGFEPVNPLPEQVTVLTQKGVVDSSALRVTINMGEAVTGIEIVVRPVIEPITPPSNGTGPVSRPDTLIAYAVLAVAGLAVAMFAGGLALRVHRKVA
ncbi:MAG: hypothetical protein IH958_04160 [Chloroflexi bacterium]|nr:hypothetical protein [Chloroflexota bacterium]